MTKGREWELGGTDSGQRQGGWAGETEAWQRGCCPASALWLFGQGMDIFSPKSDTVK